LADQFGWRLVCPFDHFLTVPASRQHLLGNARHPLDGGANAVNVERRNDSELYEIDFAHG